MPLAGIAAPTIVLLALFALEVLQTAVRSIADARIEMGLRSGFWVRFKSAGGVAIAGKSTIAKPMLELYPPTGGATPGQRHTDRRVAAGRAQRPVRRGVPGLRPRLADGA